MVFPENCRIIVKKHLLKCSPISEGVFLYLLKCVYQLLAIVIALVFQFFYKPLIYAVYSLFKGINVHIFLLGNGYTVFPCPAIHNLFVTGTVNVTLIFHCHSSCFVHNLLLLRSQSIINVLIDAEEQTVINCIPHGAVWLNLLHTGCINCRKGILLAFNCVLLKSGIGFRPVQVGSVCSPSLIAFHKKVGAMPCFGTTKRTRSNAERLCELLGTRLRVIDIADSVKQHFKDIGHDESNHNVVYENGQARERTKILMDLANAENGMVIGTGDLSELALGWATYNGDHMSMYGVNASVPKTLVRYIVKYYAGTVGGADLREVLMSIYDTPVSPELLPADENGDIAQITEDLVGPYELHDFFLYNGIRWCFPPSKVFRLAEYAFDGSYDRETILKWLRTFYRRFFSQQFKRSCLPDGVKVGSVTLSPRRCGWRKSTGSEPYNFWR